MAYFSNLSISFLFVSDVQAEHDTLALMPAEILTLDKPATQDIPFSDGFWFTSRFLTLSVTVTEVSNCVLEKMTERMHTLREYPQTHGSVLSHPSSRESRSLTFPINSNLQLTSQNVLSCAN